MRTVFVLGMVGIFAAGCKKNAITGRREVNLIPDGVMNALGKQGYQQVLSEAKIHESGPDVRRLRKVGRRISEVAGEPSFDWAYHLLQDDTVNAWCMPGGYIGFYDGILPYLRTEAGMAFVMGHEVGHATARHGAQRLTQQLGVAGALTLVQAFLAKSASLSEQQKNLIFGALGLGAEVGLILPFSRAHESEADLIGLMYMAGAGYPPGQAIGVWRRMGASGPRVPEFLSTHPSPERRIEKIEAWLPRARKRFRRNRRPGEDSTQVIWE